MPNGEGNDEEVTSGASSSEVKKESSVETTLEAFMERSIAEGSDELKKPEVVKRLVEDARKYKFLSSEELCLTSMERSIAEESDELKRPGVAKRLAASARRSKLLSLEGPACLTSVLLTLIFGGAGRGQIKSRESLELIKVLLLVVMKERERLRELSGTILKRPDLSSQEQMDYYLLHYERITNEVKEKAERYLNVVKVIGAIENDKRQPVVLFRLREEKKTLQQVIVNKKKLQAQYWEAVESLLERCDITFSTEQKALISKVKVSQEAIKDKKWNIPLKAYEEFLRSDKDLSILQRALRK